MAGWAARLIERLRSGEPVEFRPRGNSMTPRVRSGDLVRVEPFVRSPKKNDVVLCTVKGRDYLHLVKAVDEGGRYQIANNHGHVNGWVGRRDIHGLMVPCKHGKW